MEFETNNHTLDEEARFKAVTKRVVLQPVSSSVVPDPATGAELNDKLSETANQPNVSTDSEDTSAQYAKFSANIEPSTIHEHEHPKTGIVIGSTVMACLFTAAFIWIATQ